MLQRCNDNLAGVDILKYEKITARYVFLILFVRMAYGGKTETNYYKVTVKKRQEQLKHGNNEWPCNISIQI